MNIARRMNGKIRPQDTRRKAVALFLVWMALFERLRCPGIEGL
jgi:hypothetical protein